MTLMCAWQIKRNTRLRDDEWSDVEEDEREAKIAKKGLCFPVLFCTAMVSMLLLPPSLL